jgi:hypothetical protein
MQPLSARTNEAIFDVDVRSHGLQTGNVNVHRPCTDRTASGQ